MTSIAPSVKIMIVLHAVAKPVSVGSKTGYSNGTRTTRSDANSGPQYGLRGASQPTRRPKPQSHCSDINSGPVRDIKHHHTVKRAVNDACSPSPPSSKMTDAYKTAPAFRQISSCIDQNCCSAVSTATSTVTGPSTSCCTTPSGLSPGHDRLVRTRPRLASCVLFGRCGPKVDLLFICILINQRQFVGCKFKIVHSANAIDNLRRF